MKKKEGIIKRILKMVKPHIKLVLLLSLLALAIDAIEVFKPYLVKNVIDNYLSFGLYIKDNISITVIGIIYIILVLVGNSFEFIVQVFTNRMGENIVFNLRNEIYKYMEYSNISFHDRTPSGKLFTRITSDADDISSLFKDVITTFIKDIILIISLIIIMIYISYKLSLVSLIIIPFVIIVSIFMTKLLSKIYEHTKTVRTKLYTFFSESIYGLKLIKIFNRQEEKKLESEYINDEFIKAVRPSRVIESMLSPIMKILENLGISIIIFACINKFWGLEIEPGIIYLFTTYITAIFEPINRIIENVEIVQEAMASIDKIYDMIGNTDNLENMSNGLRLEKIQGKIEFKNVWFAYEKENWVLKNISFTIEPGQSVALVGKTGSGKTTITNLINRFYEIQKGEILIDGINIKDINIKCLRENIGTILQDPFLYAKSMKDNIKMDSKEITDEKILEAIKLSSSEDMINSLPNGINEIAGERGNNFSAGEKQLIAFARIFAHNPSIFILDEATANIDTQTEKAIQKSIDKISKEKTSIFIAHRLSTIVNVDKIIVLSNGEILEEGNHVELMEKKGNYFKLYEAYYKTLTKNAHIDNII